MEATIAPPCPVSAPADLRPQARPRWDGLEELRPTLQRYLARRCRDTGELDDVVQETFLRAARYRGRLIQAQSLRGWALRIALNVLHDLRRREEPARVAEATRISADDPRAGADLPCVDDEDEELELCFERYLVPRDVALALLRSALLGLRVEERQLLAAYYGPTGGPELAALQLSIPRELVKVRVFRLRRRLRAALRRRLALVGERWIER